MKKKIVFKAFFENNLRIEIKFLTRQDFNINYKSILFLPSKLSYFLEKSLLTTMTCKYTKYIVIAFIWFLYIHIHIIEFMIL